MMKLPFIIKLVAQMNNCKFVRQKHGQNALKVVRTLEQVKRR